MDDIRSRSIPHLLILNFTSTLRSRLILINAVSEMLRQFLESESERTASAPVRDRAGGSRGAFYSSEDSFVDLDEGSCLGNTTGCITSSGSESGDEIVKAHLIPTTALLLARDSMTRCLFAGRSNDITVINFGSVIILRIVHRHVVMTDVEVRLITTAPII
ncbi:hypothetical protein SGCOL_000604 [Colletotrichum sp. CLE4]